MIHPDKRNRYSSAAQWDFAPGTPNANNRTTIEAKTSSMARVPDTYEQNEKGEHILVPGNKSARDTFRVTTARQIPENGKNSSQLATENQVLGRSDSLPSTVLIGENNNGTTQQNSSEERGHSL